MSLENLLMILANELNKIKKEDKPTEMEKYLVITNNLKYITQYEHYNGVQDLHMIKLEIDKGG